MCAVKPSSHTIRMREGLTVHRWGTSEQL